MELTTKYLFDFTTSNGVSISHDVYESGLGKAILLLQELPGIDKNTMSLVDALASKGFKVIVPHLFGKFGKSQPVANFLKILCIRKEMDAFARNLESPLLEWLHSLCKYIKDKEKVDGIGVIGMCFTGNFAISLISDSSVQAAVTSQPSLPIFKHKEIGFSKERIEEVKTAIDKKGPILAYRFESDKMCKKEKFNALREQLNTGSALRVITKELPSEKKKHSVITKELFENANELSKTSFEEIVSYFNTRL